MQARLAQKVVPRLCAVNRLARRRTGEPLAKQFEWRRVRFILGTPRNWHSEQVMLLQQLLPFPILRA
jgi:hypothetical protein